MRKYENKEIIIQAKNGDKQAFTELIMDMEDDLYKIARTRLNNEDNILDAIQETIISAYKSIHKLRQIDYFKTWIIKILINKCNDMYKQKMCVNLDEQVVSSSIYIEAKTDSDLNFDIIMQQLNNDERIVMTLYYLEKYTTKEIGKILKVNENTIKTRISRAKIKIKNTYKGDI